MTSDDLDPRDLLASAHLDGLTSAEEAARVAADPDLQSRVAAMEAVRAALRAPVPIDETARDRAIAAALDAFPDARGGTVTDLAAVAARRGSASRVRRLVGIAAALLLIALAVPVLGNLTDDGGDEDMAATALDESSDRSSEGAEAARDDDAGDDATEEAAPGAGSQGPASAGSSELGGADGLARRLAAVDLGDLGSREDLRDAVQAALRRFEEREAPAPVTSSADASAAELGCTERAQGAGGAGSVLVLSGTAVLDGREVRVTVIERADGRRTLTVADAAGCEVVLTEDLEP